MNEIKESDELKKMLTTIKKFLLKLRFDFIMSLQNIFTSMMISD